MKVILVWEIPLPLPIETYVRAENSGDADAISECFAPCMQRCATLITITKAVAAIKSWKANSHDHKITPLAINTSNGSATLRAQLSGRFPGSPVTANFLFAIVDNQIASLQIRC